MEAGHRRLRLINEDTALMNEDQMRSDQDETPTARAASAEPSAAASAAERHAVLESLDAVHHLHVHQFRLLHAARGLERLRSSSDQQLSILSSFADYRAEVRTGSESSYPH